MLIARCEVFLRTFQKTALWLTVCFAAALPSSRSCLADGLSRLRLESERLRVERERRLPATRTGVLCGALLSTAVSMTSLNLALASGARPADWGWLGAVAIIEGCVLAVSPFLGAGPGWLVGSACDRIRTRLDPETRHLVWKEGRYRLMVGALEHLQREEFGTAPDHPVIRRLGSLTLQDLRRQVSSESHAIDDETATELLGVWNESDDGLSPLPDDPVAAFVAFAADRVNSGR